MIKEPFLGHVLSHFHINPIVKAYIISDSLLWSAWNFVTPIFAIFVVNNINGGNIESASIGFSIYLISRVIFELLIGRYLIATSDKRKMLATIVGMVFISLAYLGFAYSGRVYHIFFFYVVAGAGLGIASPAKNSLFSIHLDKNKETEEWGLADAISFTGMALSSTVGGIIAKTFGFQTLFLLAFGINLIATLPYLIFLNPRVQKYITI